MNEFSVAFARWAADRHRMGRIIGVEVEQLFAAAAVVEVDGQSWNRVLGIGTVEDLTAEPVSLVGDWIRRVRGDLPLELVVGGMFGPAVAGAVAETAGLERVLIPDRACQMAAMGEKLSPRPIEARLDLPTGVTDRREMYAAVMEKLAEGVARSGFDFDDCICEVSAGVRREGDTGRVFWKPISLTIEDGAGDGWELIALRATARVDTRSWELPRLATGLGLPQVAAIRKFGADGQIIPRDDVTVGKRMSGPLIIRADCHFTVVRDNWSATRQRAGGILMESNSAVEG